MQNHRPNFAPGQYGQGPPPGPGRPSRGPGPINPISHAGGPMPQHEAQRALALAKAAQDKREEARNRSQKPVDRKLPDDLEDLVVGDGVQRYKNMQGVEHKLDAIMMRKRLDMQDSVYKEARRYGTMRVWVSNTCSNQSWQYDGVDQGAFDFNGGATPMYRLRIEGRLLEDGEDKEEDDGADQENAKEEEEDDQNGEDGQRAAKRQKMSPPPPSSTSRNKLSHFFRNIRFELAPPNSLRPDSYYPVEWSRPNLPPNANLDPPKEADFDRLEYERSADENINVTIKLTKSDSPERYKLKKELAELLDMEEADRDMVLMGIWEYIKLAGVRVDDDRRHIYCDQRLGEIFGESIYFPNLPQLIMEKGLMVDLPPIQLPYTIRVDKAFHSTPSPQYTIYDIRVPLPSSHKPLPLDTAALKEITTLNDTLALINAKITASQAKHKFLTSLAADPANFIKRWTSSQKRDLDVIMGKGPWVGADEDWQSAEWRRGGESGVWGSREAQEGVGTYLGKGTR